MLFGPAVADGQMIASEFIGFVNREGAILLYMISTLPRFSHAFEESPLSFDGRRVFASQRVRLMSECQTLIHPCPKVAEAVRTQRLCQTDHLQSTLAVFDFNSEPVVSQS